MLPRARKDIPEIVERNWQWQGWRTSLLAKTGVLFGKIFPWITFSVESRLPHSLEALQSSGGRSQLWAVRVLFWFNYYYSGGCLVALQDLWLNSCNCWAEWRWLGTDGLFVVRIEFVLWGLREKVRFELFITFRPRKRTFIEDKTK